VGAYLIRVRGRVDVDDLNPRSPHHMTAAGMAPNATWLNIYTDQSGLIAVLRHLHNLGLTLLSVILQGEEDE